jgi:hypothetical protein
MENKDSIKKIKDKFKDLIINYNLIGEIEDNSKSKIYIFSLSNEFIKITFHGERFEKDLFTIKIENTKYPRIPIGIYVFYYFKNKELPKQYERIKTFDHHASFLKRYYNHIFCGEDHNFRHLIYFRNQLIFYEGLMLNMSRNHKVHVAYRNGDLSWIRMMGKEFYENRCKEINHYLEYSGVGHISLKNLNLLKNNKKKIVDSIFEYVGNENTLLEINRNRKKFTQKFDNNDLSWIDEILEFINNKDNV